MTLRDVEAAGIEADYGQEPNRMALREFGRIGFENHELPPPFRCPSIPWSPPESPPVVEAFWRRQGRVPPPA